MRISHNRAAPPSPLRHTWSALTISIHRFKRCQLFLLNWPLKHTLVQNIDGLGGLGVLLVQQICGQVGKQSGQIGGGFKAEPLV